MQEQHSQDSARGSFGAVQRALASCYPSGKSVARGCDLAERTCPPQRKSTARKKYFREPHHPDQRVVAVARKNFSFVFSEIMFDCGHPASMRGALRAIVTTREAGMRWT